MIGWLGKIFGRTTNEDIIEIVDEVLEENNELWAKYHEQEANRMEFETRVWEFVEGKLAPLNRRVAQRLKRAEERDSEALNTGEVKRTGVIPTSDLRRKRGLDGSY